MSITCGANYPAERPQVKFNSKINLPCVSQQDGTVSHNFKLFNPWNPATTLEKMLIGIKNEMVINKKLAQPADGDMF